MVRLVDYDRINQLIQESHVLNIQKEVQAMKDIDKNPQIEKAFTYHAPKEGQPHKYQVIREAAKILAYEIDELCPNSREKSLALTKLEEAVFWANASIARHE